MFSARFFIEVSLSNWHPDGYDAVDMQTDLDIPFVPVKGMMMAVHKDGDYFHVDEVFWKAEDPAVLQIYVKEASGLDHEADYFREQGWAEQH